MSLPYLSDNLRHDVRSLAEQHLEIHIGHLLIVSYHLQHVPRRVNGLVGTLPVSEAQIKAMNIRSDANITVYVSAIRFTKRQITFSLTPTTNNDLAVGSRVQCTVVKATAHHVFCTFPKRGRLYDAAIRSSEFYWNRPTDVPCQPGDRINAVITGEEIIGKTKYIDAQRHGALTPTRC